MCSSENFDPCIWITAFSSLEAMLPALAFACCSGGALNRGKTTSIIYDIISLDHWLSQDSPKDTIECLCLDSINHGLFTGSSGYVGKLIGDQRIHLGFLPVLWFLVMLYTISSISLKHVSRLISSDKCRSFFLQWNNNSANIRWRQNSTKKN